MIGAKAFRWGERPPKWFMKEVAKAFELMGKNREAAHTFDLANDWSVVFLMVNTSKAPELMNHIQAWYAKTFGGEVKDWPLVDSETKKPIP